jgi:hypothetical protein
MVLEITTIDVKEKPKNKDVQIIALLDKLCAKIDTLNENVRKLPDPETREKKKYPFIYLVLIVATVLGGWLWTIGRSAAPA